MDDHGGPYVEAVVVGISLTGPSHFLSPPLSFNPSGWPSFLVRLVMWFWVSRERALRASSVPSMEIL